MPFRISGLRSLCAAVFLIANCAAAQDAANPENSARFRTLDENYAEVARIAPLFAGLYVDGDTLVYRLATKGQPITEAQQREVVTAVKWVFGTTLQRFDDAPRRFEIARFAMSDLTRWHASITVLQEFEEFTFLDLDERRSVLVLGAREGTDIDPLCARLKELHIPLEAVDFRTSETVRM